MQEPEEMENPEETRPSKSTRAKLIKTSQGLYGSAPGPLCIYDGFQLLWFPVQCFHGIPEFANEWVSVSCAFSWIRFLQFFFFLSNFNVLVFCSGLLYFIYDYYYSLEGCLFLMRQKKKVEPDWGEKVEKNWEKWRKENILKIYHVRKISLLNRGKNRGRETTSLNLSVVRSDTGGSRRLTSQ